jgi:HEAT repeat protein
LHRFLWFVPAGAAWFMDFDDPHALKFILTAVAVSSVMAQFTAAAWQSWMADLVPSGIRGQFWSDRQVAISSVMLLATLAWGVMLDKLGAVDPRLGFAVVFSLAAVGGVADILIHFKVVEPAPVREPMTREFLKSAWERLSGPLLHPGFRRLALAMGMWTFAAMMVGPFGNLYLKQKFGVSYSALSLMAASAAFGTVVYCKGVGYLMDRLSARTVGGVCVVMGPLFSVLAWMFVGPGVWHVEVPLLGVVEVQRSVAIITGVSLMNAGFFGGVGLAHINLLADVVPQRGRTVAMAVQFVIIGAFGALGAFLGGRLVDFIKSPNVAPDGFALMLPGGAPLDYIHILVGILALVAWCVVLPLLLGVRLPNEKIKFSEALDRMVLVNPVRFATGIYNARILTQPSSRKSRFKAVEAIGNNATVIALADLVDKTRDPSVDIREAATHSLGKIGNAEAIHALAAIATQPDSDIVVPALRALRGCALPSVAPALIPLLSHLNIEVVREAARTLGAARNPDAIEPLAHLLHATRQAPVAVAAAEALSLLGDTSAIYAIIPRMRGTTADAFHRAYAVNAADLLGERDMFYKILTTDDHAHGAGLALLVKRLRAAFEHDESLKNSPLREDAFVHIRNIDLHYEARELAPCAKNIFDLARAFAILRHNIHYRDDLRAFLAALEARDPLFAAGVWYTAVLNGALQRDDTPDSLAGIRTTTEALLGVFILASWAKNLGG